jgi:hypothetical protein
MDLDDAILLLRDPRLGKSGMILAAKLAARELGPVVIADDGGVWDTRNISTDQEWIAFARYLRDMVRRKRLS